MRMRGWLWRLIQAVVFTCYVATQLLMYSSMSWRLNNALLRIENLERLLSSPSKKETILRSSSGFKENSMLEKNHESNGAHEHVRLRRSVDSTNKDITSLLNRLEDVEKR